MLGLAHISRTNGVIPEDLDVSPEEKAPVQMLAMPDRFMRQKKMEKLAKTKNLYGTNAVSKLWFEKVYLCACACSFHTQTDTHLHAPQKNAGLHGQV